MREHGSHALTILTLLIVSGSAFAQPLRPFTVADDIGIALFGDPNTRRTEAVTLSPDGKRVVVHTERGSLENNRPEDELRIYSVDALQTLVKRPGKDRSPAPPLWILHEATGKDGGNAPVVTHIRWLRNSTAFAFLLKTEQGSQQLLLADVDHKQVQALSRVDQDVVAFDIRDQTHYVFTLRHSAFPKLSQARQGAASVGTGLSLWDVLYPENVIRFASRSDLWAAVAGPAAPITNPVTRRTIELFIEGAVDLVLSPDGNAVATAVALEDVPKEWERLYPPPYVNAANRVRAGHQDPEDAQGWLYISEYAVIDLGSGRVTPLTGTPTGISAGWLASGYAPAWSEDGRAVIMPGTFLPHPDSGDVRPCVAVADLTADTTECVYTLKRQSATGFESGIRFIDHVGFSRGRRDQIILNYRDLSDDLPKFETYARHKTGHWQVTGHGASSSTLGDTLAVSGTLKIAIRQDLNTPPVLAVADLRSKRSRTVWDPNPQLKGIALADATVYRWRDETGREWVGGLYKPPNFEPGRRYPLVIQNHGFDENEFRPSGGFPTEYAARELATAGIVVLQMRDCEGRTSPTEGSCNVMGYEAAVEQLDKDGVVDRDRIGMIGFSRTVFYVMDALTTSTLHVRAASICDGVDLGYMQHLLSVDAAGGQVVQQEESMIGAAPYGVGLATWLKRSPEFNMDKVTAPLMIQVLGRTSALGMWEPYALLREMRKPVDLIIINSEEHTLTNPAARMVSQGTSVDWFRFWLQDYEDSSPDKVAQYIRWRGLKMIQAENDAKGKAVTRPD